MTLFKKLHKYFLIVLSFVSLQMIGQEGNKLWKTSNLSDAIIAKEIDWTALPKSFQVYQLNETEFQERIDTKSSVVGRNSNTKKLMPFPNAHGKMEMFEVKEQSIFAPELQAKFPEISSFVGRSLENPGRQVRFSVSPFGINAVIFDREHGSFYVDKINNSNAYVAYQRKDASTHKMLCMVEDQVQMSAKNQVQARSENANDGSLRTFRLAIATTGEYSQYHITDRGINSNATDEIKIAAVMDAINVAMTRVNEIFHRDVGLTMELVANNDQLIFLDPETDEFSNNDTNALINESQTKIDQIIGTVNYDIGHTFSTGAGGLAQLNGPCTGSKARAVTGISAPKGDAFYVDFVAHEMGHQYGANHTFNGTAGNCSGNENSASAVEPGSGTTIMGYAGICSPENVQNNGDDYFHLVSIREMWTNISVGASTCAELTATGNTAPVIEALEDHTIPISTPFALGAAVTDAEGDLLTYTWEQLDNETAEIPLVSTATGGPAFRSFKPAESNVRYFPRLRTTLDGETSNLWEVLPTVERTMNFGVNVRDNNAEVGQTASDETFLSVTAEAGPFLVTSQNSNVTWDAGTSQTITWDVANTDVAPVNCQFVNILLSHDGGQTFTEVLAENVENNGSHNVVAPGITTSEARIMIQSVGNVFFAVNSEAFSIQDSEFIMEFATTHQEICAPQDVSFDFKFKTFLGFNENTTFSASGNPSGTTVSFSPVSASTNNTAIEMAIQGITEAQVGTYEITVTGTSNSVVKNTLVTLDVYASSISVPTLTAPANGSINIKKPYTLMWNGDANVEDYVLEIATDTGFSNIIENVVVSNTVFEPQNIASNSTYFWRVKGRNNCGESSYSEVFSFATENEICNQYTSNATPLPIPDAIPAGVFASIEITDDINISDVNVGITISHTWVGDLRLILSDPHGNSVVLVSNSDRSGTAYTNTIFDSDENIPIGSGTPPFSGTFSPEGDLSIFKNLSAKGTWSLNVSDNEPQDVGNLENFDLFICGVPQGEIIDDDNDGVSNENDLCPNTPEGAAVDATGCPVNSNPEFTVLTVSETCPDQNNGIIEISAQTTGNYTATFNGQDFPFTSFYAIENISPGDYQLCIAVDGEDFEQCYNITIEAGVVISAKAALLGNKLEIAIEEGTAPYKVFKNDVYLFETSETKILLDVGHGDLIAVSSKEDCEGVYSKEINLLKELRLYPNPASEFFNISVPSSDEEIRVELFSSTGQLIRSETIQVQQHKVSVETTSLPQGLYFVKVGVENPVVLKMLKE